MQTNRGSIRHRLTRKLLLALVLLALVAGLAVYWQARTALEAQFDAALRVRAEALAGLAEQQGGQIEIDFSDKPLREFEAGGDFVFELRARDGKVLERSTALGQGVLPARFGATNVPVYGDLVLPDGRAGRAIGMRFQVQDSDDSAPGAAALEAVVVVASSRESLDRTLRTVGFVLASGGLILLLATFMVVPRILRRELLPLRQIAEQAAAIDVGSLSTRFPTTDLPDEIAPITARLNELLGRLEESFARERRFSSDVAHEFRTPITELRSFAELALKLPEERPPNTDQEVLNITLHLERMLGQLLILARGEQNELRVESELVDVGALVSEVCRKFQGKAELRHVSLKLHLAGETNALSDPALLRSILMNLIDNALEYSPAGEAVTVEVGSGDGRIEIRVINAVHDVSEQDLPRLFERFWRKDAARSSDGHTGLGLSLARVFAQALGCELTAGFTGPARLALTLVSKPGTF